jgi:4-hydroxybenzoate polyprenyltransferase
MTRSESDRKGDRMKKLKSALARFGPDVLLVCGAGTVSVGFGLAWLPLGVIVAGLALIAFAVLCGTGGDER